MEELKELLFQVADSYFDFVQGVLLDIRDNPNKLDDIVQFIKDNPQATSSDIIRWTMVEIDGIDPNNPPELEIVDDDEDEE